MRNEGRAGYVSEEVIVVGGGLPCKQCSLPGCHCVVLVGFRVSNGVPGENHNM